jgi:hypothetical protein
MIGKLTTAAKSTRIKVAPVSRPDIEFAFTLAHVELMPDK